MNKEIIIQDEDIIVLTPKRAITPGHVIITTVNEYHILEEVPPAIISKMFQISNKLSSVLFDTLKCHGTNILIQNGTSAGQINARISVNVIPRFDKDNLLLEWTPTAVEPEKLQIAQTKFADVEEADKSKKYLEEQKVKAEEKSKTPIIKSNEDKKKRNYFLRSLEKVA
jgi:diadenosine tetraphosphate (Ap4A) HIT family hydrolase